MSISISPDSLIYWQLGPIHLNATILYTWIAMALLVGIAAAVTRRLRVGPPVGRWQHTLEIIVENLKEQIGQASRHDPDPFLPFIGTLFLFIATANLLGVIPGYTPPVASLSTTAALAICVFVAVPLFGIRRNGLVGYLRKYLQPMPVMLPFNIIGEFSRTLALAVRLFGNIMSTDLLVVILLAIVPLFFPVVMELFGLLVGFIQAYVFAILAMVYIASSLRTRGPAAESGA
jgi:F-type H+-transporting ATPase subunit a